MMAAVKPMQTLLPVATQVIRNSVRGSSSSSSSSSGSGSGAGSSTSTPKAATPVRTVVQVKSTDAPVIDWPDAIDEAKAHTGVVRAQASGRTKVQAARGTLKAQGKQVQLDAATRRKEAAADRAAVITARNAAIADSRASLATDQADLRARLAAAGILSGGSAGAQFGAMADASNATVQAEQREARDELAAIRQSLEQARRADLLALAETRRKLRLAQSAARQDVAQARRAERLTLSEQYQDAMAEWRAAQQAHNQAQRAADRATTRAENRNAWREDHGR